MFLLFLRRAALACCLPLAAHAGSLCALRTTELTPAAAAEAVRPFAGRTFTLEGIVYPLGTSLQGRGLPGLAAVTPVTAAEQDGALYVVARDQAGRTLLLRRAPSGGWEHRAPPPSPLLAAALAVSQSHIFFLSPDPAGQRLQLVAYHTITDTWAV